MLVALIVIAVSLSQMVPAPTWLGWYTLAFILLFDSAYAWSCKYPPPAGFAKRVIPAPGTDSSSVAICTLAANWLKLQALVLPNLQPCLVEVSCFQGCDARLDACYSMCSAVAVT